MCIRVSCLLVAFAGNDDDPVPISLCGAVIEFLLSRVKMRISALFYPLNCQSLNAWKLQYAYHQHSPDCHAVMAARFSHCHPCNQHTGRMERVCCFSMVMYMPCGASTPAGTSNAQQYERIGSQ
jgi:hypothetical protein